MKRAGSIVFMAGIVCMVSACGNLYSQSNEETEDICLSVLAGQSTPDAGIEDMIDEKVAEILPNVRLEWECVDWGDNFDAELNARFAAGDIPDIIIGKAQDVTHNYLTGDAKLIRETNMTFMKSADTKYPDEINQIFQMLLSDEELMGEILNYTQTFSVKKGYTADFQSPLLKDIKAYEDSGQMIEATVGNTQLIWFFQNDVAEQELLWLQKKQTLEDVLTYADEHRSESMTE